MAPARTLHPLRQGGWRPTRRGSRQTTLRRVVQRARTQHSGASYDDQKEVGIMFKVEKVTDEKGQVYIQDPPVARFLFQGTIASWLWLVVRIYVGYDFLTAGWHKFTDPAWMNGSGQGIIGFWKNAVAIPAPPARPLITFDWYRGFLQFL